VSVAGGGGIALNQKLKAMVAEGSQPCAVQMYMGPNVWKWGEEGVLVSLNQVAEKEEWNKILPPLINKMIQFKGDYVAAPVNVHRVNLMWANPKVFKKSNAKIPKTWDDFFIAAEKIRKSGFIPIALGGEPWQEVNLFEVVLIGIGGIDFHRKTLIDLDIMALKSFTMVKVFSTMRKIKQYVDKDSPGRSWELPHSLL